MKLQVLAPDPFAFRPVTRIALVIARVGTLEFSKFRRGCERSARGHPGRNAGPGAMVVDINRLWDLRDENGWLDALSRDWVNPTVSKNRDKDRCVLESLSKIESSPEKQRIGATRALAKDKACVGLRTKKDWRE
jgi:hypothetical protein